MTRRSILRCTAAAVLLAGMSAAIAAWPERVVQYVIPFPAGGEADIAARCAVRDSVPGGRRVEHRGAVASRGVQGQVRQGHGRGQQAWRRRRTRVVADE